MYYEKLTWGKLTFEQKFPIVRADTLSMEDRFMQFTPRHENQFRMKESLEMQILQGKNKNFRLPAIDPSIKDGKLCYKPGLAPATGLTSEYWIKVAQEFMPDKKSHLILKSQNYLFLGVIGKYLVEKCGYTPEQAWDAVCMDSKELGHFYQPGEKKTGRFIPTGKCVISEWADLGSTSKMCIDDDTLQPIFMGGHCKTRSEYCSLANISKPIPELGIDEADLSFYATGRIVMDV